MAQSTAWILDFGNSIQAAIGELNLVHLEERAKLFAIPKTLDYCRHSLIWQDSIIPVIDLVTGLYGQNITRKISYVAIVRYQTSAQGQILYAALLLAAMPVQVTVDDKQSCSLPEQPQAWQALATSCFTMDSETIPIIDLAILFSQSAQAVLSTQ